MPLLYEDLFDNWFIISLKNPQPRQESPTKLYSSYCNKNQTKLKKFQMLIRKQFFSKTVKPFKVSHPK